MKKLELQEKINVENGINYHRNVSLSGWTFCYGESFITFNLITLNNIEAVKIDYIYVTGAKDLQKLLAQCINFWAGNNVKFIYYKAHRRKSNVAEKTLVHLGMEVKNKKFHNWKYDWTSTNGYREEDVIEAYTSKRSK